MRLNDLENNIISMYHGGRSLENSYNELKQNKSKQMEHGPGLYLTNYYSTARKYAKGGGKVYKVSFIQTNNDIEKTTLELSSVIKFISSTRFPHKKELLEYINKKYNQTIKAEHFLNLLVNFECLTPSTSSDLRIFFIENNIDYSVVENYGGFNDQTVVVIFNPKIIKKVEIVPPTISTDEYILPVRF